MSAGQPVTAEYMTFTANIEYGRDLIEAGRSLTKLGVNVFDIGDLYRAAWTQAVSALDHWLHEEISARVKVLADETSGRPHALQTFALPLAVVDDVRLNGKLFRMALAEEVRKSMSRKTLQNPDDIAAGLKLVYDGGDLWRKVAARLKTPPPGDEATWSQDSIKAALRAIMKRRNQIAHEADLDNNGDRRAITDVDAANMIDLLEDTATAIAAVVEGC
ncbi:hypothetical protein [Nocardia neocaledoniensis]|uniref:hypothetical protein n=1 Tax=Nocardia neocaledoniensis TaxID=236511 RepID=UPI00245487BC|nr:hypothetical protein [Nocardia neocaledoniensis]